MEKKDQIKQAFGSHLQKLRLTRSLSIRKLAGNSGLEYSQVQRIEQGKVNISLTTIFALAEGLDLDPKDLLDLPKK
ncbi:helix-turn-helix domain-containing protein [Pedobacter sp. 22163]|uniref:helix-turn-helix domain-containing protein n=1 Tax=Pedobacter sp. 22163 TaxID=3453883 RepID=UPI003F8684D3